jgi:hypothetical protein
VVNAHGQEQGQESPIRQETSLLGDLDADEDDPRPGVDEDDPHPRWPDAYRALLPMGIDHATPTSGIPGAPPYS